MRSSRRPLVHLIWAIILLNCPTHTRAEAPEQATSTAPEIGAFREWWFRCAAPPPARSVVKLREWVDAHPDDAEAVFFLALAYSYNLGGKDVRPPGLTNDDLSKMVQRSASLGFTPAVARYGFMLLGTPFAPPPHGGPDPGAGREALARAAEKDDPDAHMFLAAAKSFEGGEAREQTPEELQESERQLRKSIGLGAVRAWGYLGLVQSELGQKQEAIESFRRGAEAGDPSAQYYLAFWIGNGQYVKANPTESFKWMKRAAEGQQNEARAHRLLAKYYASGFGTPVNEREATRWYASAGLLGDRASSLEVSRRLLRGIGCPTDVPRGLEVLRRLIQLKYAPAEVELAGLHTKGEFVQRDETRARELLESASARGDKSAREELDKLEGHP
jgi:TPR repeat protein